MDKIRRATWHDYTQRCIYMVTLKKSLHIEPFGTLKGDCRLPFDVRGSSYVSASPTGKAIKDAIRQIPSIEPKVKILQYALMPDHVHILLFVTETTEEILGRIIARFKILVNEAAGTEGVFTKGFNDQILKSSRDLSTLFRYLRDNPRRLAVRRAHPEYFRRVNTLHLCGRECMAYGNFQLLDNPFKEAVVVHRADSDAVRGEKSGLWHYTAANGGVLVSPFISEAEKAVRDDAEACHGKVILLTAEPLGERYKPAEHDFLLCEAGKLLIVSLSTPGKLSREKCLAMNRFAQDICKINS